MKMENVNTNLKEIVIGYKSTNKKYNWVNFIIKVVAFTIYKGWCMNKTKNNSYWSLFKYELNWRFNAVHEREKLNETLLKKFIHLTNE